MSESSNHKKAKTRAAGRTSQKEKPLPGNRRLDAATSTVATEIERSGTKDSLQKAAKRLKDSGKPRKVLQVPQKDIPRAVDAMKDQGVLGTVKNTRGTQKVRVERKRKKK